MAEDWYQIVSNGGTFIDLIGEGLDDEGAREVARALKESNTTVKELTLGGNDIGAEGVIAIVEALKGNKVLQILNLWNNKIGDVGAIAIAAALEKNGSLQLLNLGGNKIGDVGAIAIAAALEKNGLLQQLHLEYNNIGEKGAIAIAAALKKNGSLQIFYLGYNKIGDEGAIAIAAALEKNRSLLQLDFDNAGLSAFTRGRIEKLLWQNNHAAELRAETLREQQGEKEHKQKQQDEDTRLQDPKAKEYGKTLHPVSSDTEIKIEVRKCWTPIFHSLVDAKTPSVPTNKNKEEELCWFLFDREWSTLPDCLVSPRTQGSLTVWNQSMLIVSGGIGSTGTAMKSVEMYSMTDQNWSMLPAMNIARHSSSSIVVDNVLYVFGGFGLEGVALDSCEMLDLNQTINGFVVLNETLPQKRANMGICYHDGQIYLVGGNYNPRCRNVWSFEVSCMGFKVLVDLETAGAAPLIGVLPADEDLPACLVVAMTIEEESGVACTVVESINLTTQQKPFTGVKLEGFCSCLDVEKKILAVKSGEQLVQYSLRLMLKGLTVEATVVSDRPSMDTDSVEQSDVHISFSRENQNQQVRERNSKFATRMYKLAVDSSSRFEMPTPPFTQTSIIDLIDEDLQGNELEYVRQLEENVEALTEWLLVLIRFELYREHKVTDEEKKWIKLIARLYRRHVPLLKDLHVRSRSRPPFDVFVAHTGDDKNSYAAPLANYLNENQVRAFLDRYSLDPGVNPISEMNWAMTTCRVMWCVLSESFVKKRFPVRELLIGYTRYAEEHQPEGKGFILVFDCVETGKYRGMWMDKVLNLEALKIYDMNGTSFPTPAAIPDHGDESNDQRYKRIASRRLGGGDPLVPVRGGFSPTLGLVCTLTVVVFLLSLVGSTFLQMKRNEAILGVCHAGWNNWH